ncbi:MAG: hypothetical protein ACXVRS_10345, partial [Gaiellaceae bacterium]
SSAMDFLVDPPAGCDEDSLRRHDWHAEQLQRLGVADVVAEIFADAVDWHEVEDLVTRGCSIDLALRISG